MIGLALTLAIVVFVPVYWLAEPGRQEAARERLLHESVERGAEVYAQQCASCHGAEGEGLAGPALRDTPLDAATFEKVVSRGLPGTGMPAFSVEEGGHLKNTEIADLAALAMHWDLAPEEGAATESDTHAEPAATEPSQSSAAAAESYRSYCASCHGADREGVAGLAPALTPNSLGDRSPANIAAIVADGISGTAMLSFEGSMTAAEIDALVTFLREVAP
jgi:mono/diheme cytochrome c family protein